MPESTTLFKTHGSQDEISVETTGFELFSMMKTFDKKLISFMTLLFSMASGVAPLITVMLVGGVTTSLSGGSEDVLSSTTKVIVRMAIVNGAMLVVQAIAQILKSCCTPIFAHELRTKIYKTLINLDVEFFDSTQTGTLIARMSEDVTLIKETYCDKFIEASKNFAFAISGVVIAFTTSWAVTLMWVATLPIILIVFFLTEKCIGKIWHSYNDKSTSALSSATEVIGQFRTVKAFDQELSEYEKYSSNLDGVDNVFTRSAAIQAVKCGLLTFIEQGLIVMLFWAMCYFIIKKPMFGLEIGDCITIIVSVLMAAMGFAAMFTSADDFRRANISSRKVMSILDKKPTVDRKSGNTMKDVKGDIEFKNVTFKYPSRSEFALKDFSMKISSGSTVAIVGESGSGKTTALQLLQRFYEVSEGQILVDGIDIKDFSQVSLRQNISSVPQTPVVFSMSVSDNIKFSKPSASDEEVINAAKAGNSHDFISDLNEGYNTEVSQTSLSGGQKQRICISRAILAKTPILLLDEATAVLDTESEQLVKQSIDNFRVGRTVIIVAHRLSTVKNADCIFVVKDGSVVESGKHDDIISQGGFYADLVKFQLQ